MSSLSPSPVQPLTQDWPYQISRLRLFLFSTEAIYWKIIKVPAGTLAALAVSSLVLRIIFDMQDGVRYGDCWCCSGATLVLLCLSDFHIKYKIDNYFLQIFPAFFSFLTNVYILRGEGRVQHINTGNISNTELPDASHHTRSVVGCIHDRLWDSAWK